MGKTGAPVAVRLIRPDQGGVRLSVSPFGTRQAAAPTPASALSGSCSIDVCVSPTNSCTDRTRRLLSLYQAVCRTSLYRLRGTANPDKPVTLGASHAQPATSSKPLPNDNDPQCCALCTDARQPDCCTYQSNGSLVAKPRSANSGSRRRCHPACESVAPRAVPPPVGDISTAQVDATGTTIDLGSAERVPRLGLTRCSRTREVLGLLSTGSRTESCLCQ